MDEKVTYERRRFMANAVIGLAAAELYAITSFGGQSNDAGGTEIIIGQSGSNTQFSDLKSVEAGVLSVGYAEVGPPNGPPVILLHGWPYDLHTYVDVAPILAAKGYRVLIPYLRGYGTTKFLSNTTPRNGQPSAVALDITALMDALKIDKAIIGGCDWEPGPQTS